MAENLPQQPGFWFIQTIVSFFNICPPYKLWKLLQCWIYGKKKQLCFSRFSQIWRLSPMLLSLHISQDSSLVPEKEPTLPRTGLYSLVTSQTNIKKIWIHFSVKTCFSWSQLNILTCPCTVWVISRISAPHSINKTHCKNSIFLVALVMWPSQSKPTSVQLQNSDSC